jgi:hypothetical protein
VALVACHQCVGRWVNFKTYRTALVASHQWHPDVTPFDDLT